MVNKFVYSQKQSDISVCTLPLSTRALVVVLSALLAAMFGAFGTPSVNDLPLRVKKEANALWIVQAVGVEPVVVVPKDVLGCDLLSTKRIPTVGVITPTVEKGHYFLTGCSCFWCRIYELSRHTRYVLRLFY